MAGVSEEEKLTIAFSSMLMDLHTAMPGRIESYNAQKQTATIQPLLSRRVPGIDGEDRIEDIPILPDVPVCFQRGGGFFASFPLQKGDYVVIIFCERDISNARRTGEAGNPGVVAMHSVNGAIALPVFAPNNSKLSSASASNAIIGKDSVAAGQIEFTGTGVNIGAGATEPIMLGNQLVSALDAMITGITAVFTAVNAYAAAVALLLPPTLPPAQALNTAVITTYPPIVTAYNAAMAAAKSLTHKVSQ